MNSVADRRAVIGAGVAAGACLSLPFWARTGAFVSDPVLTAIERHRQAHDAFIDLWGQTDVIALHDRAKADEGAAAELQQFRELEHEDEAALSSLLATKPATKASAIACVKHVADCGLATDEMRAWLAMLVQSPLVS